MGNNVSKKIDERSLKKGHRPLSRTSSEKSHGTKVQSIFVTGNKGRNSRKGSKLKHTQAIDKMKDVSLSNPSSSIEKGSSYAEYTRFVRSNTLPASFGTPKTNSRSKSNISHGYVTRQPMPFKRESAWESESSMTTENDGEINLNLDEESGAGSTNGGGSVGPPITPKRSAPPPIAPTPSKGGVSVSFEDEAGSMKKSNSLEKPILAMSVTTGLNGSENNHRGMLATPTGDDSERNDKEPSHSGTSASASRGSGGSTGGAGGSGGGGSASSGSSEDIDEDFDEKSDDGRRGGDKKKRRKKMNHKGNGKKFTYKDRKKKLRGKHPASSMALTRRVYRNGGGSSGGKARDGKVPNVSVDIPGTSPLSRANTNPRSMIAQTPTSAVHIQSSQNDPQLQGVSRYARVMMGIDVADQLSVFEDQLGLRDSLFLKITNYTRPLDQLHLCLVCKQFRWLIYHKKMIPGLRTNKSMKYFKDKYSVFYDDRRKSFQFNLIDSLDVPSQCRLKTKQDKKRLILFLIFQKQMALERRRKRKKKPLSESELEIQNQFNHTFRHVQKLEIAYFTYLKASPLGWLGSILVSPYTTITILDFGGTNMSKHCALKLIRSLSLRLTLSPLTEINLTGNQKIDDDVMAAFYQVIMKKLPQLKSLYLDYTSVSDDSCRDLKKLYEKSTYISDRKSFLESFNLKGVTVTRLRKVSFEGSKVTLKGVKVLNQIFQENILKKHQKIGFRVPVTRKQAGDFKKECDERIHFF